MTIAYVFCFFLFLFFGLVVFIGAPYVPSHKKDVVHAITKLYPIGEGDVLLDVGSGDGRILRQVSKLGGKAIGFEINPILVLLSKILSFNDKDVTIKLADFWMVKIPDSVTVVYAFIVTRDVDRLTKKIQKESNRMGHIISVVSYGNKFSKLDAAKSDGAYSLYEFKPLQSAKAQV